MSSPGEFYHSLPPVTKVYGTACFLTTALYQLQLLPPQHIALLYDAVFYRLQDHGQNLNTENPTKMVWRLITCFFWLGPFSFNFGILLLMILRYGVQLEKGPFNQRTADFLWMMMFGALSLLAFSTIPFLWSPFLGTSMVFMLLYVWSREFPNANINMSGLVQMKAFYLPWAMLVLNAIFGTRIVPGLLGIVAGHLYYFLSVLHPLAGGRDILKTPIWVQKLAARLPMAAPTNAPVQARVPSTGGAFTGRSYRLNR